MKRLIPHVVMLLMTFAFGVGLDRLIWQRHVDNAPLPSVDAVSLASLEPQRELVATVEPPAPVPAETPKPNLVLDYDPKKFNPYAVYLIMGPEKPKDFADFGGIELGVSDPDYPGYVSVYFYDAANNYDDASAVFALVTERRLFFVTSKTRNSEAEYRFDGEFLRRDFNSVAGKNKAVLRGTLTKTKNGRKIAEHTFSFRMEHLGC